MEKIQHLVPKLGNDKIQVYRHKSDYSLAWCVKTSEPDSGDPKGNHTVLYWEVTVYIGDLAGAIFTRINSEFTGDTRTDYTAEEIENKRKILTAAKTALSSAESALFPFGEYEN